MAYKVKRAGGFRAYSRDPEDDAAYREMNGGGYYQSARGRRRSGGYSSRSYNSRQPRQRTKGSGAKYAIGSNEKPYISAWTRLPKGNVLFLIASPNAEPATASDRWEKWTCKVHTRFDPIPKLVPALYDLERKRLVISELSMVANPAKNYLGEGGHPMNVNR